MRKRWTSYLSIIVLIVSGSLAVAPRVTQAASYDVGACASGATPTVISGIQIQLRGATTNALPVLATYSSTAVATGTLPSNVLTPAAGTATDYGFVWSIDGLGTVFQPGAYQERTALFTFSGTSTTVDDLTGLFPASTHTGTISFYVSTGLAGDFTTPSSFSSGMAIMQASFTATNVASTPNPLFTPFGRRGFFGGPHNLSTYSSQSGVGPDFSSAGSVTISSVTPFSLGGTCYQLGTVGQTAQWQAIGHLASPTSVNGAYTGVVATAGLMPTSF